MENWNPNPPLKSNVRFPHFPDVIQEKQCPSVLFSQCKTTTRKRLTNVSCGVTDLNAAVRRWYQLWALRLVCLLLSKGLFQRLFPLCNNNETLCMCLEPKRSWPATLKSVLTLINKSMCNVEKQRCFAANSWLNYLKPLWCFFAWECPVDIKSVELYLYS